METIEKKSRTRKKKEARALQKLGERLLSLTAEQLDSIAMPDELHEAVVEARGMTRHGARRRQIKYIGALVREIDPQPILDALFNLEQGNFQKAAVFRQVETWRDALREGNMACIDDIMERYPSTDQQRLAQLARNARAEYRKQAGVKASRALFRYLNDIVNHA